MNVVKLSLSVLALLAVTVLAQNVWAQDESEMSAQEICAKDAEADGVPAEDRNEYIARCLEDLGAAGESMESSGGQTGE